jgi:hypothetical protein
MFRDIVRVCFKVSYAFALFAGLFFALLSPPAARAAGNEPDAIMLIPVPGTSQVGQSVTFFAQVAAQTGTPTGTVTFTDGGTVLGTGALIKGEASFSTMSLTAGVHVITAAYSGDANFMPNSTSVNYVVLQPTTTSLSSSLNPSATGQSVTFTATVTGTGTGTPTGTVTFKDGATTLSTMPLSGHSAAFTTTSLAVGSHAITAVYSGDATFATSSGSLTQTVNQPASTTSTTSLSSNLNPSIVGQSVTFTATVSGTGGTPTGTVTFKDGSTVLSTVALSGNSAVFATASLAAGSHQITAVYSGDATFATSSGSLTQTVNQLASTRTTLTSSANPSNTGQPVTFTATVTGPGGTPTGSVTFKDGGATLATVALTAGSASFTTSSLALGGHSITASYNGSANFAASTSAVLTQTVQVPPDSVRLRTLQVEVTRVEAQSSGDAFASAVSGAIAEGFSGGGSLVTPTGTGLHFNFGAEPDGRTSARSADAYDPILASRASVMSGSTMPGGAVVSGGNVMPGGALGFAGETAPPGSDAFAGLAYAPQQQLATKAPPPAAPKDWLLWADVRGTGWNTDAAAGDIRGGQVNALFGLTRKVTPDFLIGVVGGYENFDYTSQTLSGRLNGEGWTVGSYLGWRILPDVRFDAAVGRSGISYEGAAGTASASFPGDRWIASGGFTGTYRMQGFEVEPSATVFAIWEHDSAYIDSLGTQQANNDFSTGRASSGVKVAYPFALDVGGKLSPYVGLYADYYFSSDNAGLLLPDTFVQGWAARTTAGISYDIPGGAKFMLGGEFGGLGSQTFTTWTMRGRVSVPF